MMKKKVFESKYVYCFEWQEQNIFEIVWLPATEFGVYEEFLEVSDRMLEGIKLHFVLSDARQMAFPITPDLQIAYGEHSTKMFIEKGCKKLAILLPDELIANLSVQQLVDEVDDMKFENMFETKYFSTPSEALLWLKYKHSFCTELSESLFSVCVPQTEAKLLGLWHTDQDFIT